MMKRIISLIGIAGWIFSANAQQDSQFTQYIFNGIHINPAYAGYKEDIYVQSFYRSQWTGIKGAPKTFSVAADGAFNNGKVGLGLIVTNDQLGAQSYLTAYANYAYRIRTGYDDDGQLAFGIAAGIVQMGLDGNKLEGYLPGDELIPLALQTSTVPDARFGIYYANESFFAGFSMTNMLAKYIAKKNLQDNRIPVPQPHLYFTAGALFPFSEDVKFKPVILFKDDINGPSALDITTFLQLKELLWIGAFARTSFDLYKKDYQQKGLAKEHAMGVILEVFATENIRIGYSYDYSLNKLRNYNYGSHELSAGFYINRRTAAEKRQLRCNKF
ncbi:type IX secretion system membrane protein PorP/SprF [Pedobacter heparinus]|uniref:PorP/SprF family type IX secretion system membrane protein n=1 Tax=Pedobacter heparinus TaxID=984 RepID=UPI00292D5F76|nr:type IX secretion system membrane protein PorP/SprF [Pedobacter heparinus]